MKSHLTALTQKHKGAIAALAAGQSLDAVAAQAGVSLRTLNRWKADPLFKAELDHVCSRVLIDAGLRLRGHVNLAIDVLAEVATDTEANRGVRVRAAIAIIDGAVKLTEAVDILERIEQLEIQLNWGDTQ